MLDQIFEEKNASFTPVLSSVQLGSSTYEGILMEKLEYKKKVNMVIDLFKSRKFRKAHKPNPEKDSSEDNPVPSPEQPKNENNGDVGKKSVNTDATPEMDDEEEDDDFIMNEVRRRLKELKRNSFMVLIPEESCIGEGGEGEGEGEGEEEEAETSSSEWRDMDADSCYPSYFGFDAVYERYCQLMLFFDRMTAQQLHETAPQIPSTPSPRFASKKLASPFRCLSLKKMEESEDTETEQLQQQPDNDPFQDIETAYVAQVCLSWEALHCQYTQLRQRISCQMESPICYNQSAQEFQHFQVLLQRFIENEPFEQGLRPSIYARARHAWPKLLQVPKVQGSDKAKAAEETDILILAPDLLRLIESSILIFHVFVKMEKKKPTSVLTLLAKQNQIVTPLQQVQSALDKKKLKLKELRKKKKNKSWPTTGEEVELLFGLIDVKILSRVLRMVRITKETLLWSEDKMKKLNFIDSGKFQRDPSPILFPC